MRGISTNGRFFRSVTSALVAFVAAGFAIPESSAQCPFEWLPGEGAPGVVGGATVFASTTWDPDGVGPRAPLAVFGGTMIGAGDVAVSSVAAWDGAAWRSVGDGLPDQVRALTAYNGELIAAAGNNSFGGTGPANGVARWNGTSWQALSSAGFQNAVRSLAVYNGELFAGGFFSAAGGVPVNNIARWNGSVWQPVGAGISGAVEDMTVFNGELIVAGFISTAGGAPANHVVRWNGSTWQPLGAGITGGVNALTIFNGELHAAGSRVFRWDGTTWQPLGGSANHAINSLAEFNGELIAGGIFTAIDGVGVFRMARWNGSSWSAVLPGPGMPARRCDTLMVYNGELYAGGAGSAPSGNQAEQVGRWTGFEWIYLGDGIDAIVYDIETYNGELIVGGWFSTAGDVAARGIARRDSTGQWHSMGDISGFDQFVYDLTVYNGVLIASGSFSSIAGVPTSNGMAQWDGESWRQFGSADVGIGKKIVHNSELYAPGGFGPNQRVARWDPVAQDWDPIGTFPPNAGATCLAFFNGDLIAGGIGGIGVNASVWHWDFDAPGTWEPIGQHLGSSLIQTIGVYNGELLVGGYSDGFGGPPGGLARFDGTSWVPLGGGLFLGNESPDEILAVFDLRIFNGELVVAGTFSYAGDQQYTEGTVAAFHVARWNGASWHALGDGTNNAVVTLHEHDGELNIGGWFDMADGRPAGHWARWGPQNPGDLDGDLDVDLADLATLLSNFGTLNGASRSDGDLDADHDVDLSDLATLLARFGTTC